MSIPDILKTAVLETKMDMDVFSRAVDLIMREGVDELSPGAQELLAKRESSSKAFADKCSQLLKKMAMAQSVVPLKENAVAIKYLHTSGQAKIWVDHIPVKDRYIVSRDARVEKHLTKRELDAILPGIQDMTEVQKYNQNINRLAYREVQKHCGLVLDAPPDSSSPQSLSISFHAGQRWVQRIIGQNSHNDFLAGEHFKQNQADIEQDIRQAFSTSVKIWTGEDFVDYYFDSDNTVYVKGDSTIITIYRIDFGFTADINRTIALKQIDHMIKLKSSIQETEETVSTATEDISFQIMTISDSISTLEAELEARKAQKQELIAQKDRITKDLTKDKSVLQAEFNKLFKKFEV